MRTEGGWRELMTMYVLAQLTLTDREAYGRYQARFLEVLSAHGGRLLASEELPEVLEGRWDKDKIVLIAFPDRAAFEGWAYGPEYEEIVVDGKAGAEATVVLIRGLD